MVKFMIMFRQELYNQPNFENAYNDFLALAERMPHIQQRQVVHITGSPIGTPPYARILELYFVDKSAMQAALMSSAGQEAGSELQKRFPPDSLTVMFADIYQE